MGKPIWRSFFVGFIGILTFAPCILVHLLYLKSTHALLFKHTFTSTFIKTLKLVKNVNKKDQIDATVCRHLFTAKTLYMFRMSQPPSWGVTKTVTATSGVGHNTGTATSFQRGLIGTDCI
jgi:hypothetical protein